MIMIMHDYRRKFSMISSIRYHASKNAVPVYRGSKERKKMRTTNFIIKKKKFEKKIGKKRLSTTK